MTEKLKGFDHAWYGGLSPSWQIPQGLLYGHLQESSEQARSGTKCTQDGRSDNYQDNRFHLLGLQIGYQHSDGEY